jgi:hypothetical protein
MVCQALRGAKLWALMVENHSEYCLSFFSKSKRYLKVKMIGLLTGLKNYFN